MSHLVLIADQDGMPHLVNFDHVSFIRPLPEGLLEVTLGEHQLILRGELQTLANDIAHQKYCDPRPSRR